MERTKPLQVTINAVHYAVRKTVLAAQLDCRQPKEITAYFKYRVSLMQDLVRMLYVALCRRPTTTKQERDVEVYLNCLRC